MNKIFWLGNLKRRAHLKKKKVGKNKSLDSSVSTVSRLRDARPRKSGSISERLKIFLDSAKCQNSAGDPPSLLFNAYQEHFPLG
jgi:hypothetical protein